MRELLFISFRTVLISYILLAAACKKAGPGGAAKLSVFVKHHSELIPSARVFVKYDAKEFPGSDTAGYDNKYICGTKGHAVGHVHISGLRPGDFYLYAVGYDSSVAMPVNGGTGITIRRGQKNDDLELTVPVTE